jgi:hypothetical protein
MKIYRFVAMRASAKLCSMAFPLCSNQVRRRRSRSQGEFIMRRLFTTQSLTLEAGQAVSGIAQRPQTLKIVSGRVWVTVEGFSHDYWLSAGDSFPVAPGRLVVVEAAHGGSRIDSHVPSSRVSLSALAQQVGHAARRLIRTRVASVTVRRHPAVCC